MTKWLVMTCLACALPSPASAQHEHLSCTRDVTRHCRSVINNGDMAVLACLKQHRGTLSRACAKTLSDNGQ